VTSDNNDDDGDDGDDNNIINNKPYVSFSSCFDVTRLKK
jgi:hypothetical protein